MILHTRTNREQSQRYKKRHLRIIGASNLAVEWLNKNKRREGYSLAVRVLRELQRTQKEWTPQNQASVSNRLVNDIARAGLVPFPEFSTTGATIKFAYTDSPASEAVSRILRVCELGAVDRIFQCKQCRTWFLGSRNDALFCKTACRVKWARAEAAKDENEY
jgi:hypothetical protein